MVFLNEHIDRKTKPIKEDRMLNFYSAVNHKLRSMSWQIFIKRNTKISVSCVSGEIQQSRGS